LILILLLPFPPLACQAKNLVVQQIIIVFVLFFFFFFPRLAPPASRILPAP
jgi:hypothetical protein